MRGTLQPHLRQVCIHLRQLGAHVAALGAMCVAHVIHPQIVTNQKIPVGGSSERR